MNEIRPSNLRAPAILGLSVLALSIGAPRPASAQDLYFANQHAAPYTQLASGRDVTFMSGGDDEGAELIPIGFPFVFYGVTYEYVNVGVNGLLTFASPCSSSNRCVDSDESCNSRFGVCERTGLSFFGAGGFPNTDVPNGLVAIFWDDLTLESFTATQGRVLYGVEGAAPNRELVVEWRGIHRYDFFGFGGSLSTANFQIRLSEATGGVKLAYGPYRANAVDDAEWSGSMGIENQDGTVGLVGAPCAGSGSACDYTELQALNGQVIEFSVPNQAELVGSVDAPTGADPGAQISVPVTVRNIGPLPTGAPFGVDVYLSTDAAIDPSVDTYLGRLSFGDLGARTATTATLVTTLSATTAPGLYRIGAVIDPANTVAEIVETNNAVVSSTVFLVGYDVAASIDAIAATGPSERVSFPIHILNNGSALPSVGYAVYLSHDQTYDVQDTLLATGSAAVPAVPDTTITVTATVPTMTPGDYYAILVVDPTNAIVEADETNNTAVAPQTAQIRGPDVVAVSVDGAPLAFRGGSYRVTATISNTGLATATGFYYSVHLSTNNLITFTDPIIGEFGPFTLEPGAQVVDTHDLAISSTVAAGAYYLGLIADTTSQILEEVENNNVTHRRDPITVRDPAPDLTASEIDLPTQAAAGESFMVARVVSNIGNAPGAASYSVFLSPNATIDPTTDVLLGSRSVTLPAATDDRGVDNLPIPSSVAAGRYYVGYVIDRGAELEELDETNNTVVYTETVDVLASQLTIVSRALPMATLKVAYEVMLAATGGVGAYTWSVSQGALPPGLSLSPAGALTGTPTAEGAFAFTVAVTDGTLTVGAEVTLLVAEPTSQLEIATHAVVPAFVGRAYDYPLTAIGGVPPYTWIARDALPAGITVSAAGVLSGTPRQAAASTVNFRVTDAAGSTADRPIVVRAINADAAVRFSNDVLPDGTLGQSYSQTVHVEPGTGASPFTFSLGNGTLPPGLELSGDTLLGVPTEVGIFSFEIRVADSRNDVDVNVFVLLVREASGVAITTSSVPKATVGAAYADEDGSPIRIRGFSASSPGAPITFAVTGGALPPGITLSSDGLLSGTPTGAGVFAFLVEARDATGQVDHRALGILSVEPPEAPKNDYIDDGCACTTERTPRGLGSVLVVGVLGLALALRKRRSRRIAGTGLFALALLLPGRADAQSGQIPYVVSSHSGTYTHRTGGSRLSFQSPFGGATTDDGIASATIPFPFHFFSGNYSAVVVSTNGFVSFDRTLQDAAASNSALGQAGDPNLYIAPFWDDLDTLSGTTYVEGTAPNRTFIIQWESVTHYSRSDGLGDTEFQVWLYEGLAGRFEVHYGATANMSPSSWSGVSGFENADASVALPLLTCASSCAGGDLTSAAGMVFVAQQDGGTDLVAQAISAPSLAYAGVPIDIQTTIASLHQDPIGPAPFEIHLFAPTDTVPHRPLFRSQPITFGAYQVVQTTTSTAIPLGTTPGRYRLALVVDPDNVLAEPNEGNNVVLSGEVRVADRQPDFTIASIVPATSTVAPGATLSVNLSLRNRGNLDGSTSWALYLSRNQVVSTDDQALASGTMTLPLLTTRSTSTQVTLPSNITTGSYWIGAIVDATDQVNELDEVNNTGVSAHRVLVETGAVNVTTQRLPRGYAGIAYSTYLAATGGDGTYAWSIVRGALPSGFTLVPTTGELRGRAMSPISAGVTVQASSAGHTATADLMLTVAKIEGGLTIVTRELLPGIVGNAYPPADVDSTPAVQQHLVAVGGTSTVTFALDSTAVPGLVLDPDGYLHGSPLQEGTYELLVRATDGTSTATRTIPLTVAEPGRLRIVAAVLPTGRLGEVYDYQIRVIGQADASTISFSTTDPLPLGLTLTSAGLITGTPGAIGDFSFIVNVTEDAAATPSDSALFRVLIDPDVGFRIATTASNALTIGTPYEAIFEALQGTPPFAWNFAGDDLPRGLLHEVRTVEGRELLAFTGSPEEAAFVTELITVTDAVGRQAVLPFSFNVTTPPPAPPPTPASDGCSCTATASARSGGDLAPGLLPAGLLALALVLSRRASRRPS